MSIGSKIDELLYNKQISQKQMAKDLKISSSTLNNYIRDYREPDVETLKLFANYFGITMDYLLEFQLRPNETSYSMLNMNEQELLSAYRCLKREQQEFLLEQTKLLIKMNDKKGKTSSDITLRTDIEKNSNLIG